LQQAFPSYEALQSARRHQTTEEFQKNYVARAGDRRHACTGDQSMRLAQVSVYRVGQDPSPARHRSRGRHLGSRGLAQCDTYSQTAPVTLPCGWRPDLHLNSPPVSILVPPGSPACVSSPFGPRVLANHPQAGVYHLGIDLPAPLGASIVATARPAKESRRT
jgi:murein DD-endopeptidase MepM/ murein hydrolase activator NlpD